MPVRARLESWLIQPQEGLQINWLNPLMRGVVAVYCPFINNQNFTTQAAVATSESGRGWSFASNAMTGSDIAALGNSATLACIADTDYSATATLIGVGASDGSDNWFEVTHNGNSAVYANARAGGTSATATGSATIRFLPTLAVGASFNSSTSRDLYVGGRLDASNTTSASVSGNNRPTLGGLYRAGLIQQAAATTRIYLGVILNRPWSADEHLEFSRRPWATVFEDQTIWAPVSAVVSNYVAPRVLTSREAVRRASRW